MFPAKKNRITARGSVSPAAFFVLKMLASVRYGTGRMEERSVAEIDGELYDRNFIAHNEEELTAAAGESFVLVREMPSDMKIWAYYLFQKNEEVRV